ncbi:MAG: hypothetical protein ACKO8H_04630, partial [Microcystis panniformis]
CKSSLETYQSWCEQLEDTKAIIELLELESDRALTQIHFRDVKSAKPLYSKQKSVLTQIDIFPRGDFIIASTREWDLWTTTAIHFFKLHPLNVNRLQ